MVRTIQLLFSPSRFFLLLLTFFLACFGIAQEEKTALENQLNLVLENSELDKEEFANELENIAQEAGKSAWYDLQIRALLERGLQLEIAGETESAKELYLQSLSIAQQHELFEQIGQSYQFLCNFERFRGRPRIAGRYLDSAASHYEQAGLLTSKASIPFIRGVLFDMQGDLEASAESFYKALKISEEQKDSSYIARCQNSLAIVNVGAGRFEEAIQYYRSALALHMLQGDSGDIANVIDNIGDAHRLAGDMDSAIVYGERSLRIRRSIQDQRGTARGLMNLSLAEMNSKKYSEATTHLDEAIQIMRSIGDEYSLVSALNRKASLYKFQNAEDLALLAAEEAQAISNRLGTPNQALHIHRNLSDIHERKGNYQLALEEYKRYHLVKDSLIGEKNKEEIAELKEQYEGEKKDRRIAEQDVLITKKEADIRKRNLIIGLISLTALLVLVLFGAKMRHAAQKRRLERARLDQLEAEKKIGYAEAVLNGQEAERGRIAKELHDGLGALLATAKIHLSQVQEGIDQLERLQVSQKAEELLDTAYSEVRRISHDMMPASLEKFGLDKALGSLCASMKSPELNSQYKGNLQYKNLGKDLEFALYRIAQEAANNCLKYAEASNFTIDLSSTKEHVHLRIKDDGKGFDIQAQKEKGLGLANMQSRAGFFGGQVTISSTEGCDIHVQIPIDHV